ncbi:SDR family NAD(P)-dependent oxidoreductase [Occultella aeris]|uniref:3-oxoacyl-[acyl-carrier-protein] reductase FabG n=1 Tax=Occultella aeris TaxID=2761496 RepID=A0A7M4DRU5_9MICO|nr:SDR family NAD(P)-dependent oxidoreductase [Occultella aeris]VZO40189.1 3-oxoacyl-[acyl-carrier-protein] reductase FabG [Occultella aeris]
MGEQTTRTIALITRANKGIGRATAAQLSALGMTVLIGTRDARRREQAAADLRAVGGDVHAVALDVTDPATAQAAAREVEARFGHLDVLINNAGITGSGQVAPQDALDQVPSSVDLDMVRSVFETNVLGVIAVINAMLPLLRNSQAPRIVNVSSHAASLTISSVPDGPLSSTPSLPVLSKPTATSTAATSRPRRVRQSWFGHDRHGWTDRRVLQRGRSLALVTGRRSGPDGSITVRRELSGPCEAPAGH